MVRVLKYSPDVSSEKFIETVNPDKLPLPKNIKITKIHFTNIPSSGWAGGHKHPRVEVFISFSELSFMWINSSGEIQTEVMGRDGNNVKVFIVKQNTPHLIRNNEETDAVMLELCSGELKDVVDVDFNI
jgi:hypothetical protein